MSRWLVALVIVSVFVTVFAAVVIVAHPWVQRGRS